MNARETIEYLRDKGYLIVYELYNATRYRKSFGAYRTYENCVIASGFDLDEMVWRESDLDADIEEFYEGVLVAHTEDHEWYIMATILQ